MERRHLALQSPLLPPQRRINTAPQPMAETHAEVPLFKSQQKGKDFFLNFAY